MITTDQELLLYLRQYKPYLYDVELQVQTIRRETGFGDISINLKLQSGKVTGGEILATTKRLYVKRDTIDNGVKNV
jgi:hypothetical protein